jgi:hypothetical protein
MLLLVIYVLIALGFSFLCSIAEAVILSVTTPHIMLLKKQGKRVGAHLEKLKAVGAHLEKLKADINSPLAAILTLNTIAHTVGAAGAGAQATKVFGDAYIGVASWSSPRSSPRPSAPITGSSSHRRPPMH